MLTTSAAHECSGRNFDIVVFKVCRSNLWISVFVFFFLVLFRSQHIRCLAVPFVPVSVVVIIYHLYEYFSICFRFISFRMISSIYMCNIACYGDSHSRRIDSKTISWTIHSWWCAIVHTVCMREQKPGKQFPIAIEMNKNKIYIENSSSIWSLSAQTLFLVSFYIPHIAFDLLEWKFIASVGVIVVQTCIHRRRYNFMGWLCVCVWLGCVLTWLDAWTAWKAIFDLYL